MSPEMLGREVGDGAGRPTKLLLRPPSSPRAPQGSHPWQPAPSLVWPVTKRKERKEGPWDPCWMGRVEGGAGEDREQVQAVHPCARNSIFRALSLISKTEPRPLPQGSVRMN